MFRHYDAPRSVAAVTSWLNGKNLNVINIDGINTGNDCFFHSLKAGVFGNVTDSMSAMMGEGLVPPNGVDIASMNVQDLRKKCSDTFKWILNSEIHSFQEMKEMLRLHVQVEVREHLGPDSQNLIAADATFEQGKLS